MATPYQYDLVCIGSGPAGQRAAVQAAKLRKRVAVVERRRLLGGVCVGTGTIPSKTFREAVLSFSSGDWTRRQQFRPDTRPTADQLLERVEDVVREECLVIENQLRRNEVEVVSGEARFKDPHTLVVQGDGYTREVSAANILIAVGTRPAPPPGVTSDGDTVLISDEILGLKRIPRTLTVVGAGVIGIEYASMFGAVGVEVTLVDRRMRPLEFLDTEIVDELIHQMRQRSVTFRPGESVEQLEVTDGPPRQAVVHLESGKRIVSDMVLFSVGRIGATDADKVPYEAGIARYREIARGQILGDDSGLLKLLFHRENRRLLGVHIIGTGATELLHIGQTVYGLEGGLDYFLRTVFNYPTLAECYKVAALNAANKMAPGGP